MGLADQGRMRARLPALLAPAALGVVAPGGRQFPEAFPNPTGEARTLAPASIDTGNPFFEPLGANGRACATCHLPSDGWSLTPATAQRLFDATAGRHPLFRPRDGANAPHLPDTTLAQRRAASSLLLTRGLIRVGLPVPANAEFALDAVDDPYGFASARELSLYRRPLPSTNLAFVSTIMWDGRDTTLAQQANGASAGHAQGAVLSDEQRAAIVAFESGPVTTQSRGVEAEELGADGARGGPQALAGQAFFRGINSSRAPGGFNRRVFSLFGEWAEATGRLAAARRAVARGEGMFNTPPLRGGNLTCTTCHNAPHARSNSIGALFDLGLGAESRRAAVLALCTPCLLAARASAAGRGIIGTTGSGAE